ncbi:MAG: class II fumarate hydratase [Spirochaetia bacterium]|nr:class II fumarate hydratase [Spirochaetia bacterium]
MEVEVKESSYRVEYDSMGSVQVPKWAKWGAHTQRALQNFSVSPFKIHPEMRNALALIKLSAAKAHERSGSLSAQVASAIESAAREVMTGKLDVHFPLDVFQTGSGTSWNMNMNEVLAYRAKELLQAEETIHPNDHVNRGQSSNDVIPAASNIAARTAAGTLCTSLNSLAEALERKGAEYSGSLKLGRTHLQDAVPMRVSQEFGAWAEQIRRSVVRITQQLPALEELPLGGTAVGTGLNSSAAWAEQVAEGIAAHTSIPFKCSTNPFVQISARDEQLALMGSLNGTAVVLMKIAQDFRLLSSGPRAGLAELELPELQPGSSIMPGKVNPVIPEMVIQAAAFVMGKQSSVSIAAHNAPLQLNIMQPLISHEVLTSLELLSRVAGRFETECVRGVKVPTAHTAEAIEKSLALITPLAVRIGYDSAAALAHKAFQEGKTVRQVVLDEGVLSSAEADEILDPEKMCGK